MRKDQKKSVKLADFLELVLTKAKLINYEIILSNPKEVAEQLEGFCDAKVSKNRLICAWFSIINAISAESELLDISEFFTEKVIDFLIEHNIELVELGHLQLKEEWLLRIYNVNPNCDEALFTVGIQRLFDEAREDSFFDLIVTYPNEALCEYILMRIVIYNRNSEYINRKANFLCTYIASNFDKKSDIFVFGKNFQKYLSLLESHDTEELERASCSQDYLELLAVSLNERSTTNALKNISNIKSIKFAKQIKENARKRLETQGDGVEVIP